MYLSAICYALNSAVTSGTGHSPAYLNFARELRAPADVLSEMCAIVENDSLVGEITTYLRYRLYFWTLVIFSRKPKSLGRSMPTSIGDQLPSITSVI